ncbi:MAG: hypothetical protein ACI9C1_001560 [Candidatus Aldehydirespiratoraceae bacterium]|jgi:hypothetical protein
MTTIEILGAEPPADPSAPLKGRVVVLTVALLIASVALLAMFASPESVTTRPGSPEPSPNVRQAGAPYGEVSPTQPLIRITTSDGTRILPTGELKGPRLLHAMLIEERPEP